MPDTVLYEDGDDITENSLATALTRGNTGDYVESGIGLTADFANNDLDIAAGMAVIQDGTDTYVALPDARSNLTLTDAAVNYVFLDYDPSTDEALSYHIDTQDSAPSTTSLKVGTVDTSNDTTTELNRAPDIAVDALEVAGRRLDSDDDGVLENADVDALTALAAGDAFTGYPLAAADLAQLDASITSIVEDTSANKPAAGTEGRIFLESDTQRVLYDDGASWLVLGSQRLQDTDGDLAGINLVDGAVTVYDATADEVVADVNSTNVAASNATVNGADVEVDHFSQGDGGTVQAGDAAVLYVTSVPDGGTLYVTRATHLHSNGTAAPTGVDLGIVTLAGDGTGTWQTTILSGDGATIFDDETTGWSYANTSGGPQTVAIACDNGNFAGASGGRGSDEDMKNDVNGRVA